MPASLSRSQGSKKTAYEVRQFLHVPGCHLAFPDRQDLPSPGLKTPPGRAIAAQVCSELGFPEVTSRLRHGPTFATPMAMPEAAIDEDDLPASREDQIGRPRHVPAVQTETKAEPMRDLAHQQLGRRTFRPHMRHAPASLCSCQPVYHDRYLSRSIVSCAPPMSEGAAHGPRRVCIRQLCNRRVKFAAGWSLEARPLATLSSFVVRPGHRRGVRKPGLVESSRITRVESGSRIGSPVRSQANA